MVQVGTNQPSGELKRPSTRIPFQLPLRWTTSQDLQHVPDRPPAIGKFRQGQVALHLVAIPATFSLLDDIAGIRQIGDDGVRVPLGDTEVSCDLAQANIRILGDAEQCPAVVGEEAPVSHRCKVPDFL